MEGNSLATIQDYLMVNLNGHVLFNIDGILNAIVTGKIFEYPNLSDGRCTLMGGKKLNIWYNKGDKGINKAPMYTKSFLHHGLSEMISHSTEVRPGWFENKWSFTLPNGEVYEGIEDILFYDEFLFLIQEDLIEIEEVIFLSEEDIFGNFSTNTSKEEALDELKPMYECKTKKELRKVWAKIITQYHPDKEGDIKMAQLISQTYHNLAKNL